MIDEEYCRERINFLAERYLHGEISWEDIRKNQNTICDLLDKYLAISKTPNTLDALPVQFLTLREAIKNIN